MTKVGLALVVGLLTSPLPLFAQQQGGGAVGGAPSTLQDARDLISRARYDDAIAVLRNLVVRDSTDAEVALELARAYHWKKDYPDAKRWYSQAAHLNSQFSLEIIGLLDDLNESEEIVALADPAFRSGNRAPSLLGSLLTADERLGRKSEASQVLQALLDATYSSTSDLDYRNFILSYHSLVDGDTSAALSYLKQVSSPSMRAYARSDKKFTRLFGNPDFERLTQE